MAAVALGIDLGTTFSCVGAVHHETVEVIPNAHGSRITPSVVYYGDVTRVGEEATEMRALEPQRTIYQVKRFMGKDATDESLQEFSWDFEVVGNAQGGATFRVDGTDYSPERVSADILKHMKNVAKDFLGYDLVDAVITVPAKFNNAQRTATRDAGRIAGLNVLSIVNEPTAAAIAYGYKRCDNKSRVILVFDLGGGTFDVSIVRMQGLKVDVLSTEGDMNLGGENFDQAMFDDMTTRFAQNGMDADAWPLKQACERAKRQLSKAEMATIAASTAAGGTATDTMTRGHLNELIESDLQKTISLVEQALAGAKLRKADLDEIVLVGGSTRIPLVAGLLAGFFPGQQIKHDIHPDEAVAFGAAVLAHSLAGASKLSTVMLRDVTPLSLGMEVDGGLMCVCVPKNTPIPHADSGDFDNPRDRMQFITFTLYEGERTLAKDNHRLGAVSIRVPPRPKGMNKLKVIFEIDANGILTVRAMDLETRQRVEVKVQTGSLTKEQVEKMKEDADAHESKDRDERDRVLARARFGDAVARIRRLARKADDADERTDLERRADQEEAWLRVSQGVPKRIYEARLALLPKAVRQEQA